MRCTLSWLLVGVSLVNGQHGLRPLPDPVPAPVPGEEAYLRIWDPRLISALEEWIHADLIAGKHWRLPDGFAIKDGAVWRDGKRQPKWWAARHVGGCIEIPPDPREFHRRSYMVPLDTFEYYEQRFEK